MRKKLIVIMANTDPRNREELGAPIFQASVAAAMGYEVELICTATAAIILKKGVAETLKIKAIDMRTVYNLLQDAHAAGVKIYCCSPVLDLFSMHKEDLIPECTGIIGAARFIEEIMSGKCKVLTY